MPTNNPFAHGTMINQRSHKPIAANTFLGTDECIVSTGHVATIKELTTIKKFSHVWGTIRVYQDGKFQEGTYNLEALVSLWDFNDADDQVIEVLYDDQKFGESKEVYGKYEDNGFITLAKWFSGGEYALTLTTNEYFDLCSSIEKLLTRIQDKKPYRLFIRPRLLEESFLALNDEPWDFIEKRDKHGRRFLGDDVLLPFNYGYGEYGEVQENEYILGTPELWTIRFSPTVIKYELNPKNWGDNGKPVWDEAYFEITHYYRGELIECGHFHVYELRNAASFVTRQVQGKIAIPLRLHPKEKLNTLVSWNQEMDEVFLSSGLKSPLDTASVTLSYDVWNWINGQAKEFEGWYKAIDKELSEEKA